MEIQYDLVLGDAILLLCFGLTWSDSWHPIFESLGNRPPCFFFRFAIKPQGFFLYGTSHPNIFDFCGPCENQVAEKNAQLEQTLHTSSTIPGPRHPKSSFLFLNPGRVAEPSRLWGPQWKQDFPCEPWFLLGLVWDTCQSDSITKLDFSPFPKVPRSNSCSHHRFPKFCFLKNSLDFDQTNLKSFFS